MATSKPEDPRGLIDLNARLPAADSPYGVAFGTRTGMRAPSETPNIDEFLLAKADRPARVAAPRPAHVTVPVTAPAVVATPVATPEAPVASAPAADDALLAMVDQPAPATRDDSSSYAERDAKSQSLEKFRGGDALVITSGALLVILLVIIIILLLR